VARPEFRVKQVFRDLQVHQEVRGGTQACKVQPDFRDLLEFKEIPVLLVKQVSRVQQEFKGRPVRRA
jgi:hypothetical protein